MGSVEPLRRRREAWSVINMYSLLSESENVRLEVSCQFGTRLPVTVFELDPTSPTRSASEGHRTKTPGMRFGLVFLHTTPTKRALMIQ